ncbi:hypothetical protein [Enterovibrio baiacu]|uniref:hypothetical protein n=1 Tax=Enterovibrio baiacu TaxID=2491023 RepID=UPI0017879414|nr:hypothetical protein [Enterovibrio baiacu]
MTILKTPITTPEAERFWASRHKCNKMKAVIANSETLDGANSALRRRGYTRAWRKKALSAFGKYINKPTMAGIPFSELSQPWWLCMPYSGEAPLPPPSKKSWEVAFGESGGFCAEKNGIQFSKDLTVEVTYIQEQPEAGRQTLLSFQTDSASYDIDVAESGFVGLPPVVWELAEGKQEVLAGVENTIKMRCKLEQEVQTAQLHIGNDKYHNPEIIGHPFCGSIKHVKIVEADGTIHETNFTSDAEEKPTNSVVGEFTIIGFSEEANIWRVPTQAKIWIPNTGHNEEFGIQRSYYCQVGDTVSVDVSWDGLATKQMLIGGTEGWDDVSEYSLNVSIEGGAVVCGNGINLTSGNASLVKGERTTLDFEIINIGQPPNTTASIYCFGNTYRFPKYPCTSDIFKFSFGGNDTCSYDLVVNSTVQPTEDVLDWYGSCSRVWLRNTDSPNTRWRDIGDYTPPKAKSWMPHFTQEANQSLTNSAIRVELRQDKPMTIYTRVTEADMSRGVGLLGVSTSNYVRLINGAFVYSDPFRILVNEEPLVDGRTFPSELVGKDVRITIFPSGESTAFNAPIIGSRSIHEVSPFHISQIVMPIIADGVIDTFTFEPHSAMEAPDHTQWVGTTSDGSTATLNFTNLEGWRQVEKPFAVLSNWDDANDWDDDAYWGFEKQSVVDAWIETNFPT